MLRLAVHLSILMQNCMSTESMNAWIFVSTFQWYSGWALSDFTFTPDELMRLYSGVRKLCFKVAEFVRWM